MLKKKHIFIIIGLCVFIFFINLYSVTQMKEHHTTIPSQNIENQIYDQTLLESENIDKIEFYVTKESKFTLIKQDKKASWLLVEKDLYPVSSDEIQKIFWALQRLKLIEKMTADKNRFSTLGLQDLSDEPSTGRLIMLYAKNHDKPIIDVIVGKQFSDMMGIFAYVRKPDEEQTWKARIPQKIKLSPLDFVEKHLINIGDESIKTVKVKPASGPSFTLQSSKDDAKDFLMLSVPKNKKIASPFEINSYAGLLNNLKFDDVRAQTPFSRKAPTNIVTFTTKEKLQITISFFEDPENKQKKWAVILAKALKGGPENDAKTLQTQFSGWAFLLPTWIIQKLEKSQSDLLVKQTD